MRTFRVDRIEGEVSRGDAGDAAVPDDVDVDVKAALPDEPWEVEGEDRVEMRVRVDALEARPRRRRGGRGQGGVPPRRRVRRPGAGRVVLRLHPLLGARASRPRHGDGARRIPGGVGRLARRGGGARPVPPGRAAVPGFGGWAGRRGAGGGAQRAGARDQPSPASALGAGRLAGAGRGGADRRCGPAVRHEREGVGGRTGAGGLLRHPALYPGHAHGDRGVRVFRARLPAGGVRPAAPPDPRRGVRGRGLGAPAPRRAGVGGRRTAARPGQARCRARVPGGGRPRRGRTGTPRRGSGGGRCRTCDRDRLPLRRRGTS